MEIKKTFIQEFNGKDYCAVDSNIVYVYNTDDFYNTKQQVSSMINLFNEPEPKNINEVYNYNDLVRIEVDYEDYSFYFSILKSKLNERIELNGDVYYHCNSLLVTKKIYVHSDKETKSYLRSMCYTSIGESVIDKHEYFQNKEFEDYEHPTFELIDEQDLDVNKIDKNKVYFVLTKNKDKAII